ncbi:helix-turn-helix domain-containing protein [Paenibacillus frigoriresistens]|uniref:helix-turn-helix domain-containing protein n=1 Tax=Paenibacillus alginolyticus TaxID=59839 RepID=UPI001564AB4E|nr:helix-turn-helix domain-containing protein [Paenibacillus frigoriresistens]NRF89869.1 helix-turn-helix domain-containing protein [Paenibacillus frigoriresistens]
MGDKRFYNHEIDFLPEINPYFSAIPDEALFSPEQVAQILNKSVETVRRWCRQEKLRSYCKGAYVIMGDDLKHFISESRPRLLRTKRP